MLPLWLRFAWDCPASALPCNTYPSPKLGKRDGRASRTTPRLEPIFCLPRLLVIPTDQVAARPEDQAIVLDLNLPRVCRQRQSRFNDASTEPCGRCRSQGGTRSCVGRRRTSGGGYQRAWGHRAPVAGLRVRPERRGQGDGVHCQGRVSSILSACSGNACPYLVAQALKRWAEVQGFLRALFPYCRTTRVVGFDRTI